MEIRVDGPIELTGELPAAEWIDADCGCSGFGDLEIECPNCSGNLGYDCERSQGTNPYVTYLECYRCGWKGRVVYLEVPDEPES